MLSPKQTKVVALIRGGGAATVTVKAQESARCSASVTRHMTEVEPIAKLDAVGGAHLKVDGDAPPETSGAG